MNLFRSGRGESSSAPPLGYAPGNSALINEGFQIINGFKCTYSVDADVLNYVLGDNLGQP